MFDITRINTSFTGLVGWRQSANPIYTQLNANQLISNSGLYFNSLSGIDFDLIESIVGNDYTDVNNYLDSVYSDSVAQLLNRFISKKKGQNEIKELLENTVAQKAFDNSKDEQTQSGRAIGWEIRPKASNNLKLQITSLGLMTNSDETVKVYLYAANKQTALFTKEISANAKDEDWTEITDFIYYYQSQTQGAGQNLYLLMYEYDANNELPAIQLNKDTKLYYIPFYPVFNNNKLQSSIPNEYYNEEKRIKISDKKTNRFVHIVPIVFENGYLNYSDGEYKLPNLKGVSYYNYSFGLNFRYNIKCDLTDIICDQVNMFAEALQYTVAIRLLWDGVNTSRVNEIQARMKDSWIKFANKYETYLYGYNDDKQGFIKGLIDKLIIDFSNLDNVCLPCRDFQPVRGRFNYHNGN